MPSTVQTREPCILGSQEKRRGIISILATCCASGALSTKYKQREKCSAARYEKYGGCETTHLQPAVFL